MEKLNVVDLHNEPYRLPDLVVRVRRDLSSVGYVVFRNFSRGEENVRELFLELCSELGRLVPHNHEGNIIWDIKPRENNTSAYATFSEHNQAAFLHTDSQYSADPEDYFGLLCLQSARCGGGSSTLLALPHLLRELMRTKKGRRCVEVLQKQKFRFVAPSVFAKTRDAKYVEHYILKNNCIRFRADTIEEGFRLFPGYLLQEAEAAYYILKNAIQNSKKIIHFNMDNDDLVFINNATVLHGREKFEDKQRHLLRIRMKVD